jgi:hypothetical protein
MSNDAVRAMDQNALVFFVDSTHEGCRGWKHLVDEDEDSLLRCKLDSFTDYIDELADSEIL